MPGDRLAIIHTCVLPTHVPSNRLMVTQGHIHVNKFLCLSGNATFMVVWHPYTNVRTVDRKQNGWTNWKRKGWLGNVAGKGFRERFPISGQSDFQKKRIGNDRHENKFKMVWGDPWLWRYTPHYPLLLHVCVTCSKAISSQYPIGAGIEKQCSGACVTPSYP